MVGWVVMWSSSEEYLRVGGCLLLKTPTLRSPSHDRKDSSSAFPPAHGTEVAIRCIDPDHDDRHASCISSVRTQRRRCVLLVAHVLRQVTGFPRHRPPASPGAS